MRTFVAIDIPEEIRAKIARFVDGVRGFADVRWVAPESLHVTLKFIGEAPQERIKEMIAALRTVKGEPFDIGFRETGFFPNAKSPRVFWVGVSADERLARLAGDVDQALVALPFLKLEPEKGPYKPHLTLARAGSGRPQRTHGDTPNRKFQRLQEKLAALGGADFGTMTAREFFLYESKLSPAGARYTKLERFPLAGA